MLVLLLLGFSSGLPLALTGGTLQAWLTVEGANLETIGLFTLVAQPYIYKFVWAPLMDRFSIPFLGRRRGWLILTQILLLATIAWMASISPQDSLLRWLSCPPRRTSYSTPTVQTSCRKPRSAKPAPRFPCSATGSQCWCRVPWRCFWPR